MVLHAVVYSGRNTFLRTRLPLGRPTSLPRGPEQRRWERRRAGSRSPSLQTCPGRTWCLLGARGTLGQQDGTVIYACLLSRRQSWCEISRPCGEQAGASGADVELTVCARPAPLDTCQVPPGKTAWGQVCPGAGAVRLTCRICKTGAPPVPQVQAPPHPEPAPGHLRAADGGCLLVVTRRRSAGEGSGRGSHRSAARRPLEGCGERALGVGCKKGRQLGLPPQSALSCPTQSQAR